MVVEGARISHDRVGALPLFLEPGDALVLNDAATFPASLQASTAEGGAVEIRLAARLGPDRFRAVLFGAGDWQTDTDLRPSPPRLDAGDRLTVGRHRLEVVRVSEQSPRLLDLRFPAEQALSVLYRHGRPVQYSHLAGPLRLWHVQTSYAARPWAFELASAGRPLTWETILELKRRGVVLLTLTHAAGLSATGDPLIDPLLPLPETYEIPSVTAAFLDRSDRGRVVAVGTSVVRALEGCRATHGRVVPGAGTTDLRLGPKSRLEVVDGILTGIHEIDTTHFQLLQAFRDPRTLATAWEEAAARGYLGHEFGDSALVFRGSRQRSSRHPAAKIGRD